MKTLAGLSFAALASLALAAGCAKEKEDAAKTTVPAATPATPAPAAFATEAPDSLKALAKFSADSAATLALAKVPHGTVQKAELERENGALNWSFDISVPGQQGISEVNVNAVTGAVGTVEHENAASEAREARADSAAARTKRPGARAAVPAPTRP